MNIRPLADKGEPKTAAISKPGVISMPDTGAVSLPNDGSIPLLKPEKFVLEYDKVVEIVRPIEEGKASWYGPNFHGRFTASGEKYDMRQMTAAHPSLPFNTLVWVENKSNGRGTLVRINDRGPYAGGRVIDLSRGAARELDMIGHGVTNVQLFVVKEGDETKDQYANSKLFTIHLGTYKRGSKAVSYAEKLRGARVEVFNEHAQKYYGVFYGEYSDLKEAFRKKKELEEKKFVGQVRAMEMS
jgi:rare lipoprotein A